MERNYSIYLPVGYDDSDISYPVLYLLHGSGDNHTGWVQFGQVEHIANKTIAQGKACPMIIVMPDANTKVKGYFNQPDGSFDYEKFFFEEFIPYIEKTYRIRSERRYRAIAGLSMGGGGTIYYALHRPDMFAVAAPLSASTNSRWIVDADTKISQEQAIAYNQQYAVNTILADSTNAQKAAQVRWYISCGDKDFLYNENSMLDMLFSEKKIPHEFRVKSGGHDWTYWRMELPEVMEFAAKSFMQF
jgi:enterochelin esterase-like enzyme